MDTKHYRESANSSDHFTGPEVRLWVHALCDEIDRLRAQAAASGEPPLFRQYVDQQVAKDMAQLYAAFSGPQPAPAPASAPDGTLHADGYFTWAEGKRPAYLLDKGLPAKFWLAAPAAQPAPARVPLTDAQAMRVMVNACDSLNITRVHELGGKTRTICDEAGLLELARAIEAAHGIAAAPTAQPAESNPQR